ncbi:DUF3035 domain-containing protein [Lacibacterium aquatile]|uniref:DUF3035 domain-containing protein n=1 Tax=Lacibacterium aquatile TaxID=1168082 RepID=A0ABW5DMD5_9PROT
MAHISTRFRLVRIAALAALALAVSACSADQRRSMGLQRTPPDEYAVVARAPLELPPDFGLRPPRPGAPRPTEQTTAQQARVTIFGPEAKQPEMLAGRTAGEAALLQKAGAPNADPNIRETVNRESTQLAREETDFVDSLVFWRAADPAGVAVDPTAEAKRLRENSALGQPVTEGETPSIKRRRRGILEGLL